MYSCPGDISHYCVHFCEVYKNYLLLRELLSFSMSCSFNNDSHSR